jgi:tetratricopeptide (TPR) repeat protein
MVEKSLHFNKNQTVAYAYKRKYFIYKGMYDEVEKLTPVINKQVKNSGFYMSLATDYFDMHDYYHFIENISKYHEIKPISEVKPAYLFNAELLSYTAMGFPQLSRKKNEEWFANINDTLLYERLKVFIELKEDNYQKALELTEAGLEKYPNSIPYLSYEVLIRNYLRDYDKALNALIKLEKEFEKTGKPLFTSYIFGYTYSKNGMTDKAKPLFEGAIKIFEEQIKFTNFDARGYYSHFSLAKIYAALNKKQQSLYYLGFLKKANNTAKLIVYDLKNDPMFDNIRREPEFQKITRELEKKYIEEHEKIKKLLISKGLEPA